MFQGLLNLVISKVTKHKQVLLLLHVLFGGMANRHTELIAGKQVWAKWSAPQVLFNVGIRAKIPSKQGKKIENKDLKTSKTD